MLLYITRKYPPSVGGMEKLNGQFVSHLRLSVDIKLISWGGSQKWLPIVLLQFLIKSIFYLIKYPSIRIIFLGDSLLSPLGVLLKILFRKKVVSFANGLDVTWSFPLYQMLIPRCLRHLDRIICISRKTQSECLARNIPQEKLAVFAIGIEPISRSAGENKVEKLRFLNSRFGKDLTGKKILLTVGRLVKRKGVQDFIVNILPLIVAKNNDVIYWVVGEGPCRVQIEKSIQEKKMEAHVVLVGGVSMEELSASYAAADIFVMPNIPVADDIEGFGLVAIEAGIRGLPVVASDLDGIKDAVADGISGILIPYGDFQKFADAVLDFLGNEEKRRTFGERSQKYVTEHYTWPVLIPKYLEEFQKISSN